jgi:hypothetical protein
VSKREEGTGNREQGTGKTSQSSQITKTPVLKMDKVYQFQRFLKIYNIKILFF